MATAACSAAWLLLGTKFATNAASIIRVIVHPKTPTAMYFGRGNLSTMGIAIALIPNANVSQAAGYNNCLTGENPRFLYNVGP